MINSPEIDKWLFPVIISLFLIMAGCNNSSGNKQGESEKSEPATPVAEPALETKEMIKRVKSAVDKINLEYVPYIFSSKKAAMMAERLPHLTGADRYSMMFSYGIELLNAGDTEKSIEVLKDLLNAVQETNNASTAQAEFIVKKQLAVAYMRKAEQDNCLINHNDESCIIPISSKAQHSLSEGAENVIKILNEVLAKNPSDLDCQYLLNVAHMTLGQYPDEVPKRFRIPESHFLSSSDFPAFKDIGMAVGVAENNRSGGTCVDDFNGDGYLDIIASSWGFNDQIKYFENDKMGGFTDKTKQAGLHGVTGGLNLSHADFNNDGHMDFIVLRGAWLSVNGRIPNSLIKNNGNGTFTDVTISSGIYSEHPTQTAVWADVDLDGWLDLFIANEWDDYQKSQCELFHNQKDGTFKNITSRAGINATGYYKGVASGDINNDLYPDIYLSDYSGSNILLINNSEETGRPSFKTAEPNAGVTYPIASFPTWIFDFNNDGLEDIFVSGYSTPEKLPAPMMMEKIKSNTVGNHPMLYQNNGNGTFREVSIQTNLTEPIATMGCNFGDLDNDGFVDFYLATGDPDYFSIVPNRMYRNVNGKAFEDVTYTGGFGHIQKGHAIGFGDFDMDGDQDIYAVMGGAFEGDTYQNLLFENPIGNKNNWINIVLEGKKSNHSAIGAKIILTIEENGSERKIYHSVGTGASFGGNSIMAELGIGTSQNIKKLEIHWPHHSRPLSPFENVEVNQTIKIIEGEGIQVLQLPQTPFRSQMTGGHQHH